MTEKEIIIKNLLIDGHITAKEAEILLDEKMKRVETETDSPTFLNINQYFNNETKL